MFLSLEGMFIELISCCSQRLGLGDGWPSICIDMQVPS